MNRGFTLIESLAVVAILAILMTMSIFVFMTQLTKGRDAKRKADLEKMRTVLEDYMNDESCYPNPEEITADAKICRGGFLPYLSELPCDPRNNINYNYFYSYDGDVSCKNWYKIYAKLENTDDPIIAKVDCAPPNGCGPSGNYNYWISSPNMNEVNQIPTAEDWWPEITLPTPTLPSAPTSTPPVGATLTPTLTPAGPTPTPPPAGPTSTPAPTSTPGPTATPVPTSPPEGNLYGCFSGVCLLLGPICYPNYWGAPTCEGEACCFNQCGTPTEPRNECH